VKFRVSVSDGVSSPPDRWAWTDEMRTSESVILR
jgi:hypothetical protein